MYRQILYVVASLLVVGLSTSSVESFGISSPSSFARTIRTVQTRLDARQQQDSSSLHSYQTSRRKMVLSTLSTISTTLISSTLPAEARYILNDEGEYEELSSSSEEPWQTTWKKRLDKANSMTTDEIFAAARGAGNTEMKNLGEEGESEVSKRRRAMSACRDAGTRVRVGVKDLQSCNGRVMGGDFDFILGD